MYSVPFNGTEVELEVEVEDDEEEEEEEEEEEDEEDEDEDEEDDEGTMPVCLKADSVGSTVLVMFVATLSMLG